MRCDSVRTSEGTVLRLDSVGRWLGRSYLDMRGSLSRYSESGFGTRKDRSTFVCTGRRVVVEDEVHADVGRCSVDERRRGPERPHRALSRLTGHYAHNGPALACAASDVQHAWAAGLLHAYDLTICASMSRESLTTSPRCSESSSPSPRTRTTTSAARDGW